MKRSHFSLTVSILLKLSSKNAKSSTYTQWIKSPCLALAWTGTDHEDPLDLPEEAQLLVREVCFSASCNA
jgi:hypothetical protein